MDKYLQKKTLQNRLQDYDLKIAKHQDAIAELNKKKTETQKKINNL